MTTAPPVALSARNRRTLSAVLFVLVIAGLLPQETRAARPKAPAIQKTLKSKPGKAPNKGKLDRWARENGFGLFQDCAHRSPDEIILKLRRLRSEFSAKADAAEVKTLLENPDFLEMGEVLFPDQLPEILPNRGAFLICDDAREALLGSSADTDMKDKAESLEFCYQDAYRSGIPSWAKKMISCFRDLTRK